MDDFDFTKMYADFGDGSGNGLGDGHGNGHQWGFYDGDGDGPHCVDVQKEAI